MFGILLVEYGKSLFFREETLFSASLSFGGFVTGNDSIVFEAYLKDYYLPLLMQIIIQPIALSSSESKYNSDSSGSNSIISYLIQNLSKIFGDTASISSSGSLQSSPFRASTATATMPPTYLYDRRRRQWISNRLLDWVLKNNNPDDNTKVLAVCDFDAYSDELNFVFGEAHFGGRVAAIYLSRLKEEFYVRKSDTNKLFKQRVIKEAVHELGHVFGLTHCEKSKCVMHFSNSLQDTDFKDHKFCERCNQILSRQFNT
jgi:archaemetzincin